MNQPIIVDVDYILSETDEKGVITFVSESFCQISGYSKKELIGKPHNIVRHPDMPKAAFKMLWDAIQEKGFWQGIVKNLAKNGDYYWVRAMVLRNIDKQGNIRYCSVRTAVGQQEIENAEKLYRTLN